GAGRVWVARRNFAGDVLAEQEIDAQSAPRSMRRYKLDHSITMPADLARELITVGVPTHATWFFAADKQLHYASPSFDAEWNDHRLTVHAKSLLRDICVLAERLDADATVSDQLVTLLPGESFTFQIESKQPVSKEQLTSPPVFRCVNLFGSQGKTEVRPG